MAISPGLHAGQLRQLLAQRLAALVEDAPHVIGRPFVGKLVIALHRLLHHDGRGRYAAVVEVDEVGIHRIGALDHAPVVLVLRGHIGTEMRDPRACRAKLGGMRLVEEAVDGERAGKCCCLLEEGAAAIEIHTQQCRVCLPAQTTIKLPIFRWSRISSGCG